MEIDKDKLDGLLRKVQALIAKADSTNFPDEADACRLKAQALMTQYSIEESMLADAAPAGTSPAPVWRTWRVCTFDNEFKDSYRNITAYILFHVGGEGVFRYDWSLDKDRGWLVMEVVGFESDLRFGEMLLTSAQLAFGTLLEPSYDSNLGDQMNAYRMRKAGMEGRRIAMALWGKDDKNLRPKARKLYEAEAQARGENPKELMGQGNSVKTYRQSYAHGFTEQLWSRLYRMRYTQGEESTALVLAGRKEQVKEAFYDRYPQFRPTDAPPIGDGHETCQKCAKAKSGYCRDHAYLRPSNAIGRSQPYNSLAASRGADAASTVDLGPSKGRLTS